MATSIELHAAQAGILRELLFAPELPFSKLHTGNLTSDHLNFHVKRLLELGLIAKTDSGAYALTVAGKEFANRLDTDTALIDRQAKVAAVLAITRDGDKGLEHLVQKRLKQPYFGFHGRPTGKIRWGETIEEGASRELMEETGLRGRAKILGTIHKMDYSPDGSLLEDKYFFAVHFHNPEGELVSKFEGGENFWMTREGIEGLPDRFDGWETTFTMLEGKEQGVVEQKFTVERY